MCVRIYVPYGNDYRILYFILLATECEAKMLPFKNKQCCNIGSEQLFFCIVDALPFNMQILLLWIMEKLLLQWMFAMKESFIKREVVRFMRL